MEVLKLGAGVPHELLQAAGAGVAFRAKPAAAAAAQHRIKFGDLTALLYLQGYHRDEFKTAKADI